MKFLQRNYVKYGLIMCGLIVLCLSYMELTGQNKTFEHSPILSVVMMLAPIVIWFLGIKAKKKQLKGQISFKQGFMEGFKISLVFAVVSAFIFLAYYKLINPEIVASARTIYGMTGASDQAVIHVDLLVQFISSIVFGSIYAAIISFFLKSKKK